MQWWCSASDAEWTWTWQAYPGVWLLVAAVGAVYWQLSRGPGVSTLDRAAGWLGVVLLWLSLDWPAGPLAAGYLASVHALQFLIVALVAPPLMLRGARAGIERRLRTPGSVASLLTHPLFAGIVFNIVVVTTHVPRVNDGLMQLQLGAFAVDAAWLVSGLLMWWPIIIGVPRRTHFGPPVQMLYLFLATLVHTGIAMVMLVRDHPMYAVYELAPRATPLSALEDLRVAGGIMELGGVAVIFGVIGVMFFRWAGGSGAEAR